jgi:hypothetical protein
MTDPEARIDAALRRIAGVHASDDLVGRVRRRIARGRPSPIRWRPVTVAAAGLLLLVAGLAPLWRTPAPAVPPTAVLTRTPAGAGAGRSAPQPRVDARAAQPGVAVTRPRRRAVVPASQAMPHDHERALDPIISLDAIAAAPLAVPPLALEDRSPAPLSDISPLTVAGRSDEFGGDR